MFNTPIAIALFVVGLLGSLTTIFCFLPQSIKTFVTRDTSGLSKWFFIIANISSLFWISIGTLSILNSYDQGFGYEIGLNAGLPSILTNVITIILNIITLVIKIQNIIRAKKENISEFDYCKKNQVNVKKSKFINKL